MTSHRQPFRAVVVGVLVAFGSTASGLPSLATAYAAERDPAGFVARKARELPPGARRDRLETLANLLRARRLEGAAVPRRAPSFDELLAEVATGLGRFERGEAPRGTTLRRLRDAMRRLRAARRAHVRSLRALERRFRKRGAPVAADRIARQLRDFAAEWKTFRTKLAAARRDVRQGGGAARRLAAAGGLMSFLAARTPRERNAHFRPDRLPFKNAKIRRAARTADAAPDAAPAPAATRAVTLAASTPPGAADLAETPEVAFTAHLDDVLEELEPNAVSIFNWVRNHVDVVPLHGSIQGATGCLATRLCSDTDTASLLIALLRRAGIPARWVRGKVRMPIAQAMNWVGGATVPDVAGDTLATGGFPSTLIQTPNGIEFVDVERTWVRVWVDFIPSRGAVQVTGDTWVDMDPAFKQFAFTPPLDVAAAVPFDVEGLVDDATGGATVNPTTGQISGLDADALEDGLEDYQAAVQTHLATTKPGFTQDDVNGKRTIIPETLPFLPGVVPFPPVGAVTETATVPGQLVESLTITLDDEFGFTDFQYTDRLAALAEKDVALSYRPATPADEAALAALIPDDPDATIEDLPTSIPAAAIDVVPELTVDGVVVRTGAPVGLGRTQTLTLTFQGNEGVRPFPNDIAAGEYHAIGLDLARIGGLTFDEIQRGLEDTREKFENGLAGTLRRDESVGRLLRNSILSWFADEDRTRQALAEKNGLIHVRLPSSGVFFSQLDVTTVFGNPSSVSSGGLTMDVDNTFAFALSRDGDHSRVVQTSFVTGQITSANEALLPQGQYTTTAGPTQSVSTMVALRLAIEQGIPIVQIDATNAATAIPALALPASDVARIQSAVAAGQTVTVPRAPVLFAGQPVVGMMVLDPSDGSGAYLIGTVAGGMTIPSIPVGVSFLIGMLSIASFLFAPIVGVILAVLVIAITIWDILATSSQIRAMPCLDESAQDGFIAIAALLPIIGAVLTVIGLIPGVGILAAFVAVSILVLLYSVLVNAAVLAAANVANQAACRNNDLEDAFGQ